MKASIIFLIAAISLTLLGCESKEEKAPTAPATPAAPAPATPAPATPAPAPTLTPATTPAGASAAATDAQAKLDQVMQYINDKKYDLAEKALSELENNKASLPASVANQLPTARTTLNAAKLTSGGAGATPVPGLPK